MQFVRTMHSLYWSHANKFCIIGVAYGSIPILMSKYTMCIKIWKKMLTWPLLLENHKHCLCQIATCPTLIATYAILIATCSMQHVLYWFRHVPCWLRHVLHRLQNVLLQHVLYWLQHIVASHLRRVFANSMARGQCNGTGKRGNTIAQYPINQTTWRYHYLQHKK